MKIKVKSKLGDYLSERGIQKKWVAEQIGASQSQLTRWCKNKNGIATSIPSIAYLIRLIKLLDCKIEELYEEVEDESVK